MTSTTLLPRPDTLDDTDATGTPTAHGSHRDLARLQDAAAALSWGPVDHPRAGRRAYR